MRSKYLNQKKATAIHESGHFVLTYILIPENLQIEISLIKNEGTLGRVTGENLFSKTTITKDDIINEVTTLYAGYYAETLLCGTKSTLARAGATDDFDTAEEILKLSNLKGVRLTSLKKQIRLKTKKLIKKYRHPIEALANELLSAKSLQGDEATLIVDAAQGNPDAAIALKNLRSLIQSI